MKREVKDHKTIAEKLDESSVLIVALEEDTQVPVEELFYIGKKSLSYHDTTSCQGCGLQPLLSELEIIWKEGWQRCR